ncbi:MAG: hypothetical protein HOC71_18740 [Candidatus Latescibacteria bacterium]|jgi:hypothetical protein|nr:hypothetical protein [Candidatus Latescibacterota bacterium]
MLHLIRTFSVIAIILLFSSVVYGQTIVESDKETLKYIMSVNVLVEDLNPDIEEDGLNKISIQTDVESSFFMEDIKVLTEHEWLKGKEYGNPFLYVKVSNLKDESGIYSYFVTVKFVQAVHLVRYPKIICLAPTWESTGVFGTVGEDNVDSIRIDVKDQVDEFINDYLAVNPQE